MKGIVIKSFVDKSTNTYLTVGKEVELTDERFKELQKSGYVKAHQEEPVKSDKKS